MTISVTHDHVGLSINAEDLDTTIDWYTQAFGFHVDQRFESHGMTFAFIVSGDAKIELMTGASDRQKATDNVMTSMNPSRLHHFALAVDDLDAAIAHLAGLGVDLIGGPMEIEEIGQRIAFVTDNLGNIIEMVDPGTWSDGRRS